MATEAARTALDWHGHAPDEWARRWDAPRVVIFRRVGSTNDEARALAEQGAPAGTVVLADEQTRGRGRHGRAWTAAPGQALLLSLVLGHAHTRGAGVLPLRVGLAAARAVEALAPLDVAMKWPNDLLVHGRKLGGILCEAAIQGGRPIHLIAGIGINMRQRDDDWPPRLAGVATSIAAAAGGHVHPPDLAGTVVRHVRAAVETGGPRLDAAELRELERRDPLRGHAILVDGRHVGTAGGVSADGELFIVDHDGHRRSIRAGTIRIADERSSS